MSARAEIDDPRLREPLPLHGELSDRDYRELGLRVGLEIHQQLLTERKLFCRCRAGLYTDRHDAEILRHMRPTLSEMGEYDGTALMEFKTHKQIIYRLKNESVCTYEMDDAPPFELNRQALEIAVAVALMLGCKIVGEIHITRKQYLDGSIPTGFQRTTIVGVDGEVPFEGRRIRIRQLALEEDSCREVSDRGHYRTYRTDRLGMPLIETVTDPDMATPAEAAAVGQILRRLARLSGLVRTGAGAARQDVNVSIDGGTRIEIKGVPSLRHIPRLVHSEALRQRSLLAVRDLLRGRGVTADAIPDREIDVTAIVRGTANRQIARAVAEGAVARAVPLPGFEGLMGAPTQPRTTFLKEFGDRVRVIACLDDLPNLACSTQETGILSSAEWARVGKACDVPPLTPVLVVWGPAADAATACREIAIRAREATLGVPSETRQALDDGTNGFERILPGPDRMYPDTDLPPIPIDEALVADLQRRVPQTPWEREEALRADGIGPDLAGRLSRHPAYDLYRRLRERLPADGSALAPAQLASLLLDRRAPRPARPEAAPWWEPVVDALARGEVLPEGVAWADGPEPPRALPEAEARRAFAAALESALAGVGGDAARDTAGGDADAAVADAAADAGPADPARRTRWLMGRVMPALRGRVAGRLARRWLEEALA